MNKINEMVNNIINKLKEDNIVLEDNNDYLLLEFKNNNNDLSVYTITFKYDVKQYIEQNMEDLEDLDSQDLHDTYVYDCGNDIYAIDSFKTFEDLEELEDIKECWGL